MKYILTKISGVFLGLTILFGTSAMAQAPVITEATQTPQSIVESVATQLFGLVKAKNNAKTADDVYFKQVEESLDNVVNFPFIAASVMGKSYKKASPAQRQEFQRVFKNGMVKSLAKGVLGYADSKVTIAGVTEVNPTRHIVKQEVAIEGATHKLDYTLRKEKSGDWKLINVVLNGVNLGQSFSGQFKASLKKYNGDIDKVIANWLADA